MIWLRSLLLPVAIVASSPVVAADIQRCTTADGKTIYTDQPCPGQSKSEKVAVPSDPAAARRIRSKLGPPGTKLNAPESLAEECFNLYRVHARDPMAAKWFSYHASIAPSGAPVLVVNAVLLNKQGGPDRMFLWCGLNEDMTIDRAATKKSIDAYRESQDDTLASIREFERKLKRGF